ncbi:hydroxymethylglutaryl-CoA reductase, degradative [Lactobacillus sp. M0390]|uniref:hydroxymethylglutaryl-CoA reductase, degradative n=1 Tax=Lactobacillus sp. M0390 TaxID=2751026 RepID=UPI0018DE91D4|nr:hydroxymethylglutaryl-CoA reductase, degradative [Lactobacillus sp. M0390]MBH9985046.1 hydroxymethylglutaryl-CoA reductase, degradative [Lactobacillus sp. M0390]
MKFYELTPEKRREYLINQGIELDDIDETTLHELNNLSENVIGQLRFPVGVVQNLLVNGKSYLVPLATEEPSVVAAANHGASIFAKNGDVAAASKRTGIYGQITLQVDTKFDASELSQLFPIIIEQANSQFASLVKHGGGVRQIDLQQKDDLVMLRVLVDPAESMGANRVNSILEFVANKLAIFPGVVDKLFAILSNYPSQFTKAQVELDVATVGGLKVAKRIALLSKIGQNDPFRAVTNNKGIMNGVDAVLLATGNDARAVEAACGVWASEKGKYSSLSQWDVKDDKLIGSLTIPLAIGTVGGSINSRTDVKQSYRLLGQDITSSELANVIAAVGLANNLAALLAISTTGIQAGHMKLQAKNTVANLTATLREKEQVRQMMIDKKEYSLAAAEQFLKQIREGQ